MGRYLAESGQCDVLMNRGQDRVPGSGVTEPTEGALWAKEDGHRGSEFAKT